MKRTIAALVIVLMPVALATAQTTQAAQAAAKKIPRWESNLTAGYIEYTSIQDSSTGNVDTLNRHIGIVKGFWYYPFLPRIVSLGLSFDYVIDDLPICVNAAINAPWKFFVPFVNVGTGFSFSGSSLKGYGAGFKLRTGKKFGLIAEYHHYTIKKKSNTFGTTEEPTYTIRDTAYFGFGIAYLY